jgi:orotate phosphoribosyltransferase-like protein
MNEIKGMHQVEGMADFIVRLKDQGVSESEICKALNKPRDEINRLLMQKGIAPAFADVEYTKAWEVEE